MLIVFKCTIQKFKLKVAGVTLKFEINRLRIQVFQVYITLQCQYSQGYILRF